MNDSAPKSYWRGVPLRRMLLIPARLVIVFQRRVSPCLWFQCCCRGMCSRSNNTSEMMGMVHNVPYVLLYLSHVSSPMHSVQLDVLQHHPWQCSPLGTWVDYWKLGPALSALRCLIHVFRHVYTPPSHRNFGIRFVNLITNNHRSPVWGIAHGSLCIIPISDVFTPEGNSSGTALESEARGRLLMYVL